MTTLLTILCARAGRERISGAPPLVSTSPQGGVLPVTAWQCSIRKARQPLAPALSPSEAEHYPHFSAREGRIPKGFYPSAQGCEERATRGWSLQDSSSLKGLWHWRRPLEREAATLSGLVGAVGAYPRVGPPPRFPRRSNPGLRDAIPLGLAENAGQDVDNAQPLGRGRNGRPRGRVCRPCRLQRWWAEGRPRANQISSAFSNCVRLRGADLVTSATSSNRTPPMSG